MEHIPNHTAPLLQPTMPAVSSETISASCSAQPTPATTSASTILPGFNVANIDVCQTNCTVNSTHSTSSVLTASLLSQTPLPQHLASWQPLLQSLKTFHVPRWGVFGVGLGIGLGVGTGVIHYFSARLKGRYNRENIKLVVSFLVRKVEQNEELQKMKDQPERLLALLEADVRAFVDLRISKEDEYVVMSTLKRKLGLVEGQQGPTIPKKTKLIQDDHPEEAFESSDDTNNTYDDGEESVSDTTEEHEDQDQDQDENGNDNENEEEEEDVDISMHDAPPLSPTSEEEEDEDETVSTTAQSTLPTFRQYTIVEVPKPISGAYYPLITPKTTHNESGNQIVTTTRRKKTPAPPSPGSYGIEYSDSSSSSEDAPPSEDPSPLPSHSNLINRAIEQAFAKLAEDTRQKHGQKQQRPRAVKPRNRVPNTPPTAIGRLSRAIVPGTDLSPVTEQSSDVSSIDEKKTQYRVAGSRKFFNSTKYAKVAESQRRPARRDLAVHRDSPRHVILQNVQEEVEEEQQEEEEQGEEEEEQGEEEEQDIDDDVEQKFTEDSIERALNDFDDDDFSRENEEDENDESQDAEEDEEPIVVVRPASSSPGAAMRSDIPSNLSSDIPSPPSSPLAKKRGRPTEFRTPQPAKKVKALLEQTPTRRSSRKTAYKGAWQK